MIAPAESSLNQEDHAISSRSERADRRRVLLLVAGGVAALLLIASGVLSLISSNGEVSGTPDNRLIGTTIPGFTLAAVTKGDVHSPWTEGHGAVVLFFAKWCTVCRTELPRLSPLIGSGSLGSVRVIGVDGDSSPRTAAGFVGQTDVRFPVGLDPDEAIASTLVPVGYPSAVVVSAKGKVLAVHYGALSARQFRDEVRLLARKSAEGR
jgi:cytochrome c biogenesis protein CcmG, thiol:disulfide interchange protein DsbE